MTTPFKDHFSGHAADYTRYRPTYPEALFAHFANLAPRRLQAWDCATGGGQAAVYLAEHFEHVHATDASAQQIAAAHAHPRVFYAVAPAERTALANGSIDFISVAQAAHWFDLPAFYAEVSRVAAPGCILALYCYGLFSATPAIDAVVNRVYHELDAWWPPERAQIESGYQQMFFPFEELAMPHFDMRIDWHLEHMLGYLSTWSAVQRFKQERGTDPIAPLAGSLAAAWPVELKQAITVRWPLSFRVARVRDSP